VTTEHHIDEPGSGTPGVSVIIPAHNEASYVSQAVHSALAQSFGNIEVIVVDDGSTDETCTRVEEIKDPRLRLVQQPHSGLATARNNGVLQARGDFVAFLDADDLWHARKLERHVAVFSGRPDLDMTFSLSEVIDTHGRPIGFVVPRRSGEVSFHQLFRENLVRNGSAAVLRAGVMNEVGLFDPQLVASTDLDMWLRVALHREGNIYCIGECLTMYRRRPGQTTSNRRRMEQAWQQVMNKAKTAPYPVDDKLLARADSDKYFYFACLAYEAGEYSNALALLRESFEKHPMSLVSRLRPWMLAIVSFSGLLFPPTLHQRIAASGAYCARKISHFMLVIIHVSTTRDSS
jgi:glycosyltransferase involved in cell wall biosynthesis